LTDGLSVTLGIGHLVPNRNSPTGTSPARQKVVRGSPVTAVTDSAGTFDSPSVTWKGVPEWAQGKTLGIISERDLDGSVSALSSSFTT